MKKRKFPRPQTTATRKQVEPEVLPDLSEDMERRRVEGQRRFQEMLRRYPLKKARGSESLVNKNLRRVYGKVQREIGKAKPVPMQYDMSSRRPETGKGTELARRHNIPDSARPPSHFSLSTMNVNRDNKRKVATSNFESHKKVASMAKIYTNWRENKASRRSDSKRHEVWDDEQKESMDDMSIAQDLS